jgi:GntR family uxuAB operon transcriptional repressor
MELTLAQTENSIPPHPKRPAETFAGSADLAAVLRRDIKEGRLASHERLLSERKMAEQFGVARGTVREALSRLVDEGLVEIRRGSGAYVIFEPPEPSNDVIENARPLELMDTRFAVEPHICRLAVLHARPKDLAFAGSLLEKMEASTQDPTAFAAADTAFHTRLAESTGNSLLIWIVGQINSVRHQREWSMMREITLTENMIREYNRQHRAILEAIMAREPERAANLMKEHLETARLSLMRSAAA